MVGCIATGSIRVAAMFLVTTNVSFSNFASVLRVLFAQVVTVERDKIPGGSIDFIRFLTKIKLMMA